MYLFITNLCFKCLYFDIQNDNRLEIMTFSVNKHKKEYIEIEIRMKNQNRIES